MRAFEIIEVLRDMDGTMVSEVAERIDFSRGTIHTYLSTLEDLGCVRSDGDEYYVGLFMIPMGEYVRSGSVMYEAGRKEVDKLTSETGEVSHFIIQHRGCEIRLYDRFGCRRRGTLRQYQRISTLIFTLYRVRTSHPGTSGDKQREAIFDGYDFEKRTPTTITDGHCSRAN